ncbi:MAG: hypothetical protein R3F59_30055 [Myxococcota bacterium]
MLLPLLLLALPAAAAPTVDGLDVDTLSRVDVRGTASAVALLYADVRALPPERRAAAAAALRTLLRDDPYTRAALQLPVALRAAVAPIPAEAFDRVVRRDWAYLQTGLDVHVALLSALDVDVGSLVGDDPLGETARLVASVPSRAAAVDAPTRARIDRLSEQVEAATGIGRPCPRGPWSVMPGQPWTLGLQLAGWHDALRRVAPFVDDPAVGAQVDAMIALLDAYGDATSASLTP